ncbi:MAG: STAS domain-containing protein [Motiliproteus sp.]|nr:STAS domain-containing protein [Motiliproteus sp.]MCW9051011.1 STAS domain-containing protein [Motiliproteus sp.]
MKAKLIDIDGGWRIEGDINYKTVVALRNEGEARLQRTSSPCLFDFSSVEQVNTSALSLLLCWYRKAKSLKLQLEFVNLPSELIAIAEMSDLSSVLEKPVHPS